LASPPSAGIQTRSRSRSVPSVKLGWFLPGHRVPAQRLQHFSCASATDCAGLGCTSSRFRHAAVFLPRRTFQSCRLRASTRFLRKAKFCRPPTKPAEIPARCRSSTPSRLFRWVVRADRCVSAKMPLLPVRRTHIAWNQPCLYRARLKSWRKVQLRVPIRETLAVNG